MTLMISSHVTEGIVVCLLQLKAKDFIISMQ